MVHHHAHHFESADAEFEAAKQGMWLFLVTEVLMFGGLFVAYAIFRGLYPEMFHAAHHFLAVKMGAINTVVLISSSLTMALAVGATQRGQRDRALLMLVVTFILAGCFLVVKYFEYQHKFHDGLFPAGIQHALESVFGTPPPSEEAKELFHAHPKANLFFSIYTVMTALHGLHVIIGMGLIAWLIKRTAKREFGPSYYTPIELVGFYWHFVDLVWIYLFPLLYLVG
jgi:cytochrome c oxidase subunit 3